MLKSLKVNNFSREGVGILSGNLFKKGEDVKVELLVPGDNIPVFFSGEVSWMKKSNSESAKYRGGLRFKKIDDSDRGKILEYIYRKYYMPVKA